MTWYEQITAIEDLEDANLDAELIDELQRGSRALKRPIRFSTPTFKDYTSSEMKGCSKNSFPAFSITAGGCALMCDHCQAKILEPMIPATNPEMLEQKVRDLVLMQDLQGFLLSGGSNRQNEIAYERYYPSVEKLKREFPHLKIAIHSALLDETRAKRMESAGVDTAMMDVIGSNQTIRDVYKLERPVEDFEATLAALCSTKMEIVPHIVIGLHYGKILGEAEALDICSRHDIHALVLVVIMPFYAKAGTFETPKSADVGRIFMEARTRLADRQVLLGCARPPGMARREIDAYAVMAGLDGIAFPADGMAAVAETIGRPFHQEHACCSIKIGSAAEASCAA
ncbi:MAG: radical SAM protein [Rhodospirillaceae bacterium]|jgi:lipoyl synthase|nr:radical SAM protein [Rhodospirillaceae bacterium]MBT5513716.1 radical SAM protein [Rhodospirillaceae bacterium]MBT6883107.1 radical SAM protein [Rhodospirillaceae bacterium]MBT7509352.1 radical SAM protein [Rhodospirillaceae bacterium]